MSEQQPTQLARAMRTNNDAVTPFITASYRTALERLKRAFNEAQPVAILIGEGRSGASFIIRSFLSSVDSDVIVARITEPCADALDVMRIVVQAIGFEPKNMSASDLEKVFAMFLAIQRTHNRRTIICLEETEEQNLWVLDLLCRFIELETKQNYGLLVLLAGRPALHDLLRSRPLNTISDRAGRCISLAPFTLSETTEYIRRRVESAGNTDISQAFEFKAIPLIHELSGGVPDAVSHLCSKCFELADREAITQVTTSMVMQAGKQLGQASALQ